MSVGTKKIYLRESMHEIRAFFELNTFSVLLKMTDEELPVRELKQSQDWIDNLMGRSSTWLQTSKTSLSSGANL